MMAGVRDKYIYPVALNLLTTLFSPAGEKARLSVVIYHRVLPEPDLFLGGSDDVLSFTLHLKYLSKNFNILPLPEAIQRLRDGTLPSRAACVTFDDGYADNAEIALPVLQKLGIPAAFFIATGCINGGMMWNDQVIELIRGAQGETLDLTQLGLRNYPIDSLKQRRQALFSVIDALKYLPLETRQLQVEKLGALLPAELPGSLMMTSEQLKTLHYAGMTIGGHTANHPILAKIKNEAVYSEIENSKKMLEDIIQAPVNFFAYPNGKPNKDYHSDHIEILKEIGFEAAFSTARGAANKHSDLYQLPRFTPWTLDYLKFMLQMSRNMLQRIEVA